jgi:hypothetical protein
VVQVISLMQVAGAVALEALVLTVLSMELPWVELEQVLILLGERQHQLVKM